jgi:hypothetical protein
MRPAKNAALRPLLVGVGLALALAACGSDSAPPTVVPTPTPTPLPTPTPPVLVDEGSTAIPALQVVNFDVTTTSAGTVTVTVDYTFADSEILLWLTDRQCSPQLFGSDSCTYLVKSLEGAKPRVMSATGVAAGTYSLFIANDGPHDPEQVTWRVTLAATSGSGSARITVGRPTLTPRR